MTIVEVKYIPSNYWSWEDTDKTWQQGTKTWDEFGDAGVLEINVTEDLQVTDSLNFQWDFNFTENVNINDLNFGPANVVINDIDVGYEPISSADFSNIITNLSPIGYEPTRPLYPGEYTYGDAIVGIQAEAKLSDARIGVYGCLLSVDVEDVTDRSTDYVNSVDISAPTKILFKRKFYKAPEEIVFNVRSSDEPAYAEIQETTDTYFTVMLKGFLTGEYVTGTIEWVATGY